MVRVSPRFISDASNLGICEVTTLTGCVIRAVKRRYKEIWAECDLKV